MISVVLEDRDQSHGPCLTTCSVLVGVVDPLTFVLRCAMTCCPVSVFFNRLETIMHFASYFSCLAVVLGTTTAWSQEYAKPDSPALPAPRINFLGMFPVPCPVNGSLP